MNTSRPDSSEKEHPAFNREATGSSPVRGSTAQPAQEQHPATVPTQQAGAPVAGVAVWHYVVVRRELTGGALLAQVLHASADSTKMHLERGGLYPFDTRGVVLVATKEQLADLGVGLVHAGHFFHVVTETDGPLAGSTTAIALITTDREALKHLLGQLRPWRAP